MTTEQNITKYYYYTFFKMLTFMISVLIIYYQFYDLSYFQIMLLSFITGTSKLAFELPSGILADFYGRRRTLILSSLLRVFQFLFLLGDQFWCFSVSALLFGTSLALQSGTDSAFI